MVVAVRAKMIVNLHMASSWKILPQAGRGGSRNALYRVPGSSCVNGFTPAQGSYSRTARAEPVAHASRIKRGGPHRSARTGPAGRVQQSVQPSDRAKQLVDWQLFAASLVWSDHERLCASEASGNTGSR